MDQIDQFDRLRKSTTLGTRRFVELIDDALRGNRQRIPRSERGAFKLAELYGWPLVLDTARRIAEQYKR